MATWGDILYRGQTVWKRLPAGVSGKFLRTNGAGADPSWETATGGSGTVTNTGTLTAGALIVGNGGTDVTVGLASANSKLLGSGAAGSGAAYSEITLGTNLSMSGTTLNASGGGGGDSIILKTADTSRNSTTTPTDDPDFTFSAAASSTYHIEFFLILVEQAGGIDWKFQLTVPAGASAWWGPWGVTAPSQSWTATTTVQTTPAVPTEASTVTLGSNIATGTVHAYRITVVLATAGSSGTFALKWSANTNDPNNSTIKANSFMRYRKLN